MVLYSVFKSMVLPASYSDFRFDRKTRGKRPFRGSKQQNFRTILALDYRLLRRTGKDLVIYYVIICMWKHPRKVSDKILCKIGDLLPNSLKIAILATLAKYGTFIEFFFFTGSFI